MVISIHRMRRACVWLGTWDKRRTWSWLYLFIHFYIIASFLRRITLHFFLSVLHNVAAKNSTVNKSELNKCSDVIWGCTSAVLSVLVTPCFDCTAAGGLTLTFCPFVSPLQLDYAWCLSVQGIHDVLRLKPSCSSGPCWIEATCAKVLHLTGYTFKFVMNLLGLGGLLCRCYMCGCLLPTGIPWHCMVR